MTDKSEALGRRFRVTESIPHHQSWSTFFPGLRSVSVKSHGLVRDLFYPLLHRPITEIRTVNSDAKKQICKSSSEASFKRHLGSPFVLNDLRLMWHRFLQASSGCVTYPVTSPRGRRGYRCGGAKQRLR